jgi:hypothetical protein
MRARQFDAFCPTAELGTGPTAELESPHSRARGYFLEPTTELGDVSQQSWELPHGGVMGSYPQQGWGLGPQQSWGLCRDRATVFISQLSWGYSF